MCTVAHPARLGRPLHSRPNTTHRDDAVTAKEVELLKSDQTLTECEISLIMELNVSLVGIGPFGENVTLNSCYGCNQRRKSISDRALRVLYLGSS
jgi:hypothetical protein